MAGPQRPKTGLLYIRANHDAGGLMARITSKLDVTRDTTHEASATGVDDIVAEVNKWLCEFVSAGDDRVTRT